MGQSPDGNSYGNVGVEFHQGKTFFGDKILNKSILKTNKPIKFAEQNSIVMSIRAPVGDINYTNRVICIGRGLCSIKYLGDSIQDFLFFVLSEKKQYFIENSTGTTFKAVNADTIMNMPLCYPPLNEQKRIVYKITKIFKEVD